ncbi:putative Peptidylprolyl isomerase [Hyella patelloides LEGE 07179]|uniref:peptidylprolyl isomerase n=1 Tax=Hyella patelloides LEGE 07179 TaxID=945734 RepID=A0A563VVC9_9CYAN|nr:peptidylprolyl isomerase [Hyella patelloides]VEP15361.1 putative Peptidylprolyl isomerase [Hyella patelloides LEGE 07179]
MFENLPRLNGTALVELIVDGSSIIIEVNGNDAPITAGNFVDLVERGVYDGVAFHRVVDDFVAQGGDPQSLDPNFPIDRLGGGGFIDPATGERRSIPLEIKLEGDEEPTYSTQLGRLGGNETPDVTLEHDRGAVAMARSQPPDSASSQFYFALEEVSFLDGDYAVFGNVTEGLDVVDSIEQGDRFEDAEVIDGLENLNAIDLFRLRNTNFPTGNYIYVSATERDNIQSDPNLNQTFELEGNGEPAFKASTEDGDDLSAFYRFQSIDVPGTYVFAGESERQSINENFSESFAEEGLAFYVYGAGTGEGIEFNRFQNNINNTFLFAGPEETANINSDSNLSEIFTDQGVAFEALV